MTVAEMRERMSAEEFLYWTRVYLLDAQQEELALKEGGVK